MKRHKSFILILEGLDASGKHTLAKALQKHLDTNKNSFNHFDHDLDKVELYSFPNYDSLVGKMLKKELDKPIPDKESITNLFAIDRCLQDTGEDDYGIIKIFDRYHVSNWAYHFKDFNVDYLIGLEKESYIGDITFIIDINPEISFERRSTRRDEYEKDLEKLKQVRQNYLELAHKFGFVILDGEKTTTQLVEDIIIHCCYRFNRGLINIHHEEE